MQFDDFNICIFIILYILYILQVLDILETNGFHWKQKKIL